MPTDGAVVGDGRLPVDGAIVSDGPVADAHADAAPDAGPPCADEDGDGFYPDTPACLAEHAGPWDCHDDDGAVQPGADEICNGLDDDCDGQADDPPSVGAGDPCSLGDGACRRDGVFECEGGSLACDAVPGDAALESCNGLDDDCDGVVDNGFDLMSDSGNCGACDVRCSAERTTEAPSCQDGECVPTCRDGWFNASGRPADGCPCPVPGGREVIVGGEEMRNPRVTYLGDGSPGLAVFGLNESSKSGMLLSADGIALGGPFPIPGGDRIEVQPFPAVGFLVSGSGGGQVVIDRAGLTVDGIPRAGDGPVAWDAIRRRFVGLESPDGCVGLFGHRLACPGGRALAGRCTSADQCFFVYTANNGNSGLYFVRGRGDREVEAQAAGNFTLNASTFEGLFDRPDGTFTVLWREAAVHFRQDIGQDGLPVGVPEAVVLPGQVQRMRMLPDGESDGFVVDSTAGAVRTFTWLDADFVATGRAVTPALLPGTTFELAGWAGPGIFYAADGARISATDGAPLGVSIPFPIGEKSRVLARTTSEAGEQWFWSGDPQGLWQTAGHLALTWGREAEVPAVLSTDIATAEAVIPDPYGLARLSIATDGQVSGPWSRAIEGASLIAPVSLARTTVLAADQGRMLAAFIGGGEGRIRFVGSALLGNQAGPQPSIPVIETEQFEDEPRVAGFGGVAGWWLLTRTWEPAPMIWIRQIGADGDLDSGGGAPFQRLGRGNDTAQSIVALSHPESRRILIAWVDGQGAACPGLGYGDEVWWQILDEHMNALTQPETMPVPEGFGCIAALEGSLTAHGFIVAWHRPAFSDAINDYPNIVMVQALSGTGRPIDEPFAVPAAAPYRESLRVISSGSEAYLTWMERSVGDLARTSLLSARLDCGQ